MNTRSSLNAETPLNHLPIGISKLTGLRTLDKFVVGGGVDGSNTCRLESLKNLQLLRECGIEGLSNVSHLDEAERLELKNMENLLHLYLLFEVVNWEDEGWENKDWEDKDWEDEDGEDKEEDEDGEDEEEEGEVVDGEDEEEEGEVVDREDEEEEEGEVVDGEDEERRRKNDKDEQLLEALQPPLNVEKLGIILYKGNIFPKWLTSLTNLRNLYVRSCFNCENLPPLGKLSLEKLELWNLKSVKRVGNEFLGIEESSEDDPSSSSSSSSVIAFPKLKSLKIDALEELEEWTYRITRKENISIMPRLSSLEVHSCPRLKALPDYLLQTTALQKLRISFCANMEELPILEDHRTTGIPRLSSLRIEYCPKLKVLPDYLLQTTMLQELRIAGCPILEERYREGEREGEDLAQDISHSPQ